MPYFLGVVDMSTKYKVNDIVEITWASGFMDSKIGDKATVIKVYDFMANGCFARLHKNGETLHLSESQAKVVGRVMVNRQYLQDFLKINNIKKTLVSKALGKSENWLTQMANDKRRDMTEETLQRILKMLHIDWSSDKILHVKTKGYVPYTTKPCTYHTDMHKERLQKAFWNGEVTV